MLKEVTRTYFLSKFEFSSILANYENMGSGASALGIDNDIMVTRDEMPENLAITKSYKADKMLPRCPGLDDGRPFSIRIGHECFDIVQGEVIYQFMYQDILSWGCDKDKMTFFIKCLQKDEVTGETTFTDTFFFTTESYREVEKFIMARVLCLMDEIKEQSLSEEDFRTLGARLAALEESGEDVADGEYCEVLSSACPTKLTARQGVGIIRRFGPKIPFGLINFTVAVHEKMMHPASTQVLVSSFPSDHDRTNFIDKFNQTMMSSVSPKKDDTREIPRIFVKTRTYPYGLGTESLRVSSNVDAGYDSEPTQILDDISSTGDESSNLDGNK